MKTLKKTLLLCIVLLGSISTSISSEKKYDSEEKINLYEYDKVKTSEDNLKNLFKNFPIFIKNGADIDFLSYKFEGTIKNKKNAKKYVVQNFNDLVPFEWHITSSNNQQVKDSGISIVMFTIGSIRETKKELNMMMKTLSEEYIHVGDEVFSIVYVENLQKHTHYVFINPETKKVLLKGNIFAVEIPKNHVAHIEKM